MSATPVPSGVLTLIVGLTASSGVASLALAGGFLALSEGVRRRAIPWLISFATGSLLAAALLGFLPAALEASGPEGVHRVPQILLVGLGAFFLLERVLLARAHASSDEVSRRPALAWIVLSGNALHNVLDGAAIAAACLASPALGIATALAVFSHELPREMGDLGVLLGAGWSRQSVILANALIGTAAVAGGVVAFYAVREVEALLPIALGLACASLLYVGLAGLLPELQRGVAGRPRLGSVGLVALGMATIWLTERGLG
jgi:zinc and cadmium transporter